VIGLIGLIFINLTGFSILNFYFQDAVKIYLAIPNFRMFCNLNINPEIALTYLIFPPVLHTTTGYDQSFRAILIYC